MDMANSHNCQGPPSECRSVGSNYRQCSQPRKISRGILIDSSAKPKTGSKSTYKEAPILSQEYLISGKLNQVEDGNRIETANATDAGKNPPPLVREIFPASSTRSFHQKLPIPEAVHGSTEQYNESCQTRSEGITVGGKDNNAAGIEKLSFATAQEVVVGDKTMKAETRGCETLRMKLWEILGPVSSPNKQQLNDYELNVGAKNFKSPRKDNGEHDPKSKQNSDTIETDSEFPNETASRLITRSLSRKRATNQLKANRTRNARAIYCKVIERKDIPCSREGFSARLSYGILGGSFSKNKSKNQGSATKTCSLDQGNQRKSERVINHREVLASGERSLLRNDKELNVRRKTYSIEPKGVPLQRDSHKSSLMKNSGNLRNVIDSPKLHETAECQDDVGYSSLKNTMGEAEAKSPPFKMRTPTKRSPGLMQTEVRTPTESFSDGSPPKRQPGGPDNRNPAGLIFDTEAIQSFKGWLASKSNCYQSNSQINYSDDAGEHADNPTVNPMPTVQEDHENTMSRSSSRDSDSETHGENSHIKGSREPEFQFLKVGKAEMATHAPHLNKKQRHLDETKRVKERSKFQQHLELEQEDGLTREVVLFALTLKKFKSKLDSVAGKRSAEILMSVAERINSQLQNAECHIQADTGKLANQGKSKRKHLEMRYQELQGELKAMHERFNEEVNQHLQHFRSTVDGLEAHQTELKVAAKKLSASNRNRLLQVEAAIETELSDAQRRITMIQNSARGKMLQLKNIVAECVKEGIFS